MIDTRARSSLRLWSSAIGFSGSPFVPFNPFVVPFLFSDRRSLRRKRQERRMPRWIGSPSGMFCLVLSRSAFHITRRSESLFIDRLRSCLCCLDNLGSTRRGLALAIHMLTCPLGTIENWYESESLSRARANGATATSRCFTTLSSTLGSSGPGAETDTYG